MVTEVFVFQWSRRFSIRVDRYDIIVLRVLFHGRGGFLLFSMVAEVSHSYSTVGGGFLLVWGLWVPLFALFEPKRCRHCTKIAPLHQHQKN